MNKEYYDDTKRFYVCSYGGCGSQLFRNYLKLFGQSFHIHSRKPPLKLCHIWDESFDYKRILPDDLVEKTRVIYLYKDPVKAIMSRFWERRHLKNVECPDLDVTIDDVINQKKDLFGIEEFYDNYTVPFDRNYKIYCIKYEALFNELWRVNELLGVPDVKELYFKRNERKRDVKEGLEDVYKNLKDKMDKMDSIEII